MFITIFNLFLESNLMYSCVHLSSFLNSLGSVDAQRALNCVKRTRTHDATMI